MHLETREIKRSGRFVALCDGEVIVKSTRQPIYDGSRALLKLEVAPDTHVTWHTSAGTPSMRGAVGELAKWTVAESKSRGGLRRLRWQPDRRFPVRHAPQD